MSDIQKEIALKVTADTGQAQKAFMGAEERLSATKKQLVEMALAGQQNTKEFRKLAEEAGMLKGKLESVEQTVDGIGKSANKIEVFSGAVQGIAASFAIAQGTAALFAEGNEELQESLVKVQASLALLAGAEQALQLLRKENAAGQAILIGLNKAYAVAVRIATAATRSFSAAIAATGIGALVVALGLLISKLLETSTVTKQTTEDMEKAAEVQKLLADQIELTNQKRQAEINLMETAGATAQKTASARLELIAEELRALEAAIETEKKNIIALEGFKDKTQLERRKKILAEKELRVLELQNELLVQTNVIKEADAVDAEAAAKLRERRELAAMQVTELQAKGFQQLKSNAEAGLELTRKRLDDTFKLTQEAREKERQKQAEYNANKKADEEALAAGAVNLSKGTFQAIADLTLFFGAQNEKAQKRAFEIQKVAAIANTLIDTYVGAQAAFASASKIPIIGAVAGPIAAATAVAAGLARVAQIRNTQFNSASTSAAPQAVRPAGIPTAPQPQAPSGFNPNTSNPNVPPPVTPQGQPQPLRAYVVDRDIENSASRRNRLREFAGI